MTDFWFSVAWTTLVAIATVMADFLAGRFILRTRTVAAVRRLADLAMTSDEKLQQLKAQLDAFAKREVAALSWGADLATVALALDLTVLGLWTSQHDRFPFFQRFDSGDMNRQVQVWLVILLVHFVLLLTALVCKHLHADVIERLGEERVAKLFRRRWFAQNRWMMAGNFGGFVALLSSFVIVMNAW